MSSYVLDIIKHAKKKHNYEGAYVHSKKKKKQSMHACGVKQIDDTTNIHPGQGPISCIGPRG
jgi:negative regulator of sigma E activity